MSAALSLSLSLSLFSLLWITRPLLISSSQDILQQTPFFGYLAWLGGGSGNRFFKPILHCCTLVGLGLYLPAHSVKKWASKNGMDKS